MPPKMKAPAKPSKTPAKPNMVAPKEKLTT
jgi:hypothetical protein